MHLLNIPSLRLESVFDPYIPQYAILSHTWENEEILLDGIRDPCQPLPVHKKGFAKVQKSCRQALHDGFGYSSSAELSEAINSLFQWYLKSRRCYAYLVDVNDPAGERSVGFQQSRWFTRGWTLQELIAPKDVRFHDHNWSSLGRRQTSGDDPGALEDVAEEINRTTNIAHSALRAFSVARKMSWAAHRRTTQREDKAYCLLGIFRGEYALVQEILKVSNDQSKLAFDHPCTGCGYHTFPQTGVALPTESPRCLRAQ
ncbi:hypothetical protein N657DRAFT_659410 [Parathielavia appendiculata]|uniref:Uncharacterized protein n=1 Tax=Parathielavia appendiculata TaxID=2587402 RepID=A0AAN6YYV6_9PEZI|nr:hypothetical protein N657DRAFT_659410 [Parathielavia appendiculata]